MRDLSVISTSVSNYAGEPEIEYRQVFNYSLHWSVSDVRYHQVCDFRDSQKVFCNNDEKRTIG